MTTVLGIDKDKVFISFIIVCLTAPSLGVIIGGVLTSYLGGYEDIKASYLCMCGALGATLLCAPIPFLEGLYQFNGVLYGILIFGGMVFPSILGIIISSVDPSMKATASSFTVTMCNLIGYIPAPFVYGLIKDNVDKTSKIPMTISLYVSFFGFFFILLSCIFRHNLMKNKPKCELDETLNNTIIETPNEEVKVLPKTSVDYIKDPKTSISIALLYHNYGGDIFEDNKKENVSDDEEDIKSQVSSLSNKSPAQANLDDKIITLNVQPQGENSH